ncbi:MAG: glucose-1-phosphate adenylyltransferase subunit GlgD [Clostridia bacterium]|nr:glucose-1-phosphate adenylyltransferase subunit GlgD [Clostridia bacterium]
MQGNDVFGIIFSNTNDEALSEMTNLRTMGSIPVAARYRMIDFPLSSMVNANITKVGIITKSNYQSLMDHIGSGKPWDLSRKNDGIFMLPPFGLGSQGMYRSRTEALNGAMDFITKSDEKYVIIADSNLVANVDYDALIKTHLKNGADITIVSADCVPPANVGKQVQLITDDSGKVKEANIISGGGEKTECSLGIYIMERYLLIRLIHEGMTKERPSFKRLSIVDNVGKLKIYACKHQGFCHVIDGLSTYFNVNMDLLSYVNRKDLFNSERPVYTKSKDTMPTRYGLANIAKNVLMADGCNIEGEVENCIISRNVTVSKGAKVKNCILMQDSFIGEDATVEYAILDKHVVVKPGKKLCGADTYPIYIAKSTIL